MSLRPAADDLIVSVRCECVLSDDGTKPTVLLATPRLRFIGGVVQPADEISTAVTPSAKVCGGDTLVVCLADAVQTAEAGIHQRAMESTQGSWQDRKRYLYRPGAECALLIPPGLSLAHACATLPGALRAVSALVFRIPVVCRRGTILVLDGFSSWSFVAAQLAALWGARLIIHCPNDADIQLCAKTYGSVLRPVQRGGHAIVGPGSSLLEAVMSETGNQGVDAILQLADPSSAPLAVDELLQCLGIFGHYCTIRSDMELDSSQMSMLSLKSASFHGLNDDAWLAAPKYQGQLLHALSDVIMLLANGDLVAPLAMQPSAVGGAGVLSGKAEAPFTHADPDIYIPGVIVRELW